LMFQNHGKTETGQMQWERDKSTVISKKKINRRKRDRRTSRAKGRGSLPPAHRSDGTLLTAGVEETTVSASPSRPETARRKTPFISRAAAALRLYQCQQTAVLRGLLFRPVYPSFT
jgi:hypothetical protein